MHGQLLAKKRNERIISRERLKSNKRKGTNLEGLVFDLAWWLRGTCRLSPIGLSDSVLGVHVTLAADSKVKLCHLLRLLEPSGLDADQQQVLHPILLAEELEQPTQVSCGQQGRVPLLAINLVEDVLRGLKERTSSDEAPQK